MNNNYHNKGNTATTTTTKQFELKASVDASKDNIIIISVTRLGDLWGITSDKFSCKSSTTNFGDFLDYFGNTTLKRRYSCWYFWATFEEFWATFYSNVWSHWSSWSIVKQKHLFIEIIIDLHFTSGLSRRRRPQIWDLTKILMPLST